jgi:hypothetical protein
MAMPGMGGASASKKSKPTLERKPTQEAEEHPARGPRVPIPGMGLPGLTRSMSSESGVTVGKEDEGHPITSERGAYEVPDIEDVKYASPTERHAPPRPPQGMHMILLSDGPVYCETSPKQRNRAKSRSITFWDEVRHNRVKGMEAPNYCLINDCQEAGTKAVRPLQEGSLCNIRRHRLSSSEDYSERAVCRKALGPYSSPQLRFAGGLQDASARSYLSPQSAISWILGSP